MGRADFAGFGDVTGLSAPKENPWRRKEVNGVEEDDKKEDEPFDLRGGSSNKPQDKSEKDTPSSLPDSTNHSWENDRGYEDWIGAQGYDCNAVGHASQIMKGIWAQHAHGPQCEHDATQCVTRIPALSSPSRERGMAHQKNRVLRSKPKPSGLLSDNQSWG